MLKYLGLVAFRFGVEAYAIVWLTKAMVARLLKFFGEGWDGWCMLGSKIQGPYYLSLLLCLDTMATMLKIHILIFPKSHQANPYCPCPTKLLGKTIRTTLFSFFLFFSRKDSH